VVSAVVAAAVGVSGYLFLQYRADTEVRASLNHCIDVAVSEKKSSLADIDYLQSGPGELHLSTDEAEIARQTASDRYKEAVSQCQTRYPVR
jgi:hypothetical protein